MSVRLSPLYSSVRFSDNISLRQLSLDRKPHPPQDNKESVTASQTYSIQSEENFKRRKHQVKNAAGFRLRVVYRCYFPPFKLAELDVVGCWPIF